MSILESIRNRAGLLIVLFVGFALLAFIMQGALESGGFGLFGKDRNTLAEINGHKVKAPDFDNQVQNIEANVLAQTGQASVDAQTKENIINQVWADYVERYAFEPQYDKLGILVSNDELTDMLWGKNVSPQISQVPIFQDSIKRQFNPDLVKKYVENLDENDEKGAVQYNQWVEFEKGLGQNRRKQKYTELVSKGFYTPVAEAKARAEFANKTALVKYVAKRYDAIPDSTIKVTDEDIRKAYDDNKFRFRQSVGRKKLDLVTFDIVPSQKDINNARKSAADLIACFKAAANDTVFVGSNTDDTKNNPFTEYIKGQTMLPYDSAITPAAQGTVLGPFLENSAFKIVKVGKQSDSVQVKARHILFSKSKYSIDQAKTKADSVRKAIKSGSDFATLARQFSDDQGSAQNGGELGYFGRGRMVKPFEDASFKGNVGDMPIVETDYGVHLIEIQKKERPILLASVIKEIAPSEATIDSAYNKATEFASTNTSAEAFEKAAKSKGYSIRPAYLIDGSKEVQGLTDSRELVVWANDDAEIGSVSKAFKLSDKFVVACLKESRSKGIPSFDEVKADAELLAKKAAKAKRYVEEFNKALTGATTIDQVATNLKGSVENASVRYDAGFIPGAGREPVLIGTIATMSAGKMSKVIVDQGGVYVVFVESVNEMQPVKDMNIKMIQKQFTTDASNTANQGLQKAVEFKADITDKRYRFY